MGRGGARGVRARTPAAGAHRHAVPLRRQPDPVRPLRAGRRRRPRSASPTTAYGYGRGARRPRRPPGALHGLLRRDAVAHPRRRRDRGPARRAADQGPDRPGAAHRARPGGRLDPVGARGRRQAAHGGAPARARRRRPGDRHRPGLRPRLRHDCCARSAGRSATPRPVRREGGLQEDPDVLRRRRALDGRGADGRPRASTSPASRSASTPPPPRPRCSSPRRSAASSAPAAAARPRRCSCRRSPDLLDLRRRAGGRSATTCSAGAITRRGRHLRRRERPARPGAGRRGASCRASWTCRSRRSAPRPTSTGCSSTGASSATRARCTSAPRRRWTSSASRGSSSPTRCATSSPSGPSGRRAKQPARPDPDAARAGHARAARRAAPRAQRAGRGLAPPHRPGRTASPTPRFARSAGARLPRSRPPTMLRKRIDRVREWAMRQTS